MSDTGEIDPMMGLFRTEVREQLAILRRDGGERSELVQAAHSIRGAARIVGKSALAEIAAELELRLGNQPGGDYSAILDAIERSDGEASPRAPEAPVPESVPDAPIAVFDIDAGLLELFREEVRSHGATLAQGLLELERDPSNPQRIEPLMRAAHSLKGAARIVGVDDAVELAHHLEDAFVSAGAGRLKLNADAIDAMLKATDVLAAMGSGDLADWVRSRAAEARALRGVCAAIARGEIVAGRADRVNGRGTAKIVDAPDLSDHPSVDTVGSPVPTEQVVRVTAQSLNRLMNLAGESLVQARWLQLFAGSLLDLRKHYDRLSGQMDRLAQGLIDGQPLDILTTNLQQARKDAARTRLLLLKRVGEFEDHAGQAEDLNSRLYREVIASRMRPFSDGGQGFPRLVRDAARTLGKSVRFDLIGASAEVDRDILEKLEAPLTHLLRNAVDHGIETPEVRRANGKPAEAVIALEARHRSGMLSITVRDDGAGIDLDRVRAKVRERALAPVNLVGRLTERELLEFLFLPGFSTAGAVTELSGRGVGLDVVHDTLRRVGGTATITTVAGQGTTFHLLLPLTLSVVRAVLVDIGGEPYAFPHTRVDRLIRIPRRDVRSLENCQFATVDGQNIGLVFAAQLMDVDAAVAGSDDLCVLLLGDATGTYGLIVDAFRGEQDLVVRPLDPRLGKVPNVSSAAILDDGAPVLIADVEDLLRSMDQFIQLGTLRRAERDAPKSQSKKRVLVVDDSITVREVQRQLLRAHGYEVDVAVDGQDGWNRVRAARYDLVVSDVDMPRMTGLELVRRIRDDDHLSQLPVIIVSYKDREEDRLRGLEVGANYYLTKGSFHDTTYMDAIGDLIGSAES